MENVNASLTATSCMQSSGPRNPVPFVALAEQHNLVVQGASRKEDTTSILHNQKGVVELKFVSNEADSVCASREQAMDDHEISIGGWLRGRSSRSQKTHPSREEAVITFSSPAQRRETREISVDARTTTAVAMVAVPIDGMAVLDDGAGAGFSVKAPSSRAVSAADVMSHSNDGVLALEDLDSAGSHTSSSVGLNAEDKLRQMRLTEASLLRNYAMEMSKNLPGLSASALGDSSELHKVRTNLLSSDESIGILENGKLADTAPVHFSYAQAGRETGLAGTRGTASAISSMIQFEQHLAEVPHSHLPAADAPVVGGRESRASDLNALFDESEQQALVKHLNWALRDDPDVQQMLPIKIEGSGIFDVVTSGILLSKFVAYVDPSALDSRALNLQHGEHLEMAQMLQNHTLCLNAAISVGCGVQGLSASQMLSSRDNQQAALQLIWNLTRGGLLNAVDTAKMPELLNLALPGEDAGVLSKYRAEQVSPESFLHGTREHPLCVLHSDQRLLLTHAFGCTGAASLD
jgi:hypothetical protein